MNYSCDIEIDLPRERVIALFDNADNLGEWMEGLESFQHVSGEPGQPGAKSELVFQMGKRRIEMIETITERRLPEVFAATYEAKGVWNLNENQFLEIAPHRTRWRIVTEFRCKGLMAVMAFLMPGMFKKQTLKNMQDFKRFAEARSRDAD